MNQNVACDNPSVDRVALERQKQKKIAHIKETLAIWSVLIIPLINLAIFWVMGTLESIPIAFEYYPETGGKEYTFWNFTYL